LDVLVVASGLTADELAVTRVYIDALEAMAGARHVEVRVVSSGHPDDSGLADDQLERRLRSLPMIGCIPQLWGRATREPAVDTDVLDRAFRPVVDWIVECRRSRVRASASTPTTVGTPSLSRHLATRRYREGSDSDCGRSGHESR
jgi:hypothetical protein